MYLKLMENFVIILKDPKINNGLSRFFFFFLGMRNKCNPLTYLKLMENFVVILKDPKINNGLSRFFFSAFNAIRLCIEFNGKCCHYLNLKGRITL